MAELTDRDRERLARILALLGSDHPGERESAALAAHRLVSALGTSWAELLAAHPEPPKVVVQRVREWDINHRDAAEARIRQLKSTTERQERQIRSLRGRVAALQERERQCRAAEDLSLD